MTGRITTVFEIQPGFASIRPYFSSILVPVIDVNNQIVAYTVDILEAETLLTTDLCGLAGIPV